MSEAAVLPFALKARWIVTVESKRHFVKLRHRTRWYAVARRMEHDERRYRCSTRADAIVIAEWLREGFASLAEGERIKALYDQLPAAQRREFDAYLNALRGRE